MGVAWKYWTHMRLEMSGNLKRQEIAVLRAFFQQQFQVDATDELSDSLIQAQLCELCQLGTADSKLAAGCLRCYISHQIVITCTDLSQKFQLRRYLTQTELLTYVLNDLNPLQAFEPRASYLPLAVKITQTFQARQGGLANWTKRLVLQHKDLYRALASCGIYMASDWAILNHADSQRLQRQFSGWLSAAQLAQTTALLNSFHAVYRRQRLQLGAGQRCAEPTLEQLEQMAAWLCTAGLPAGSPEQILRRLKALARDLRQPQLNAILLNTVPLNENLATPSPQSDEQDEFLTHYQIQVRRCLKRAVRQVFEQRLLALQAANPAKAATFMRALTLFVLDQMPMAQIAPLVGLQKQFQVTRLLNLSGLRAEVRQQWLVLMRQELPRLLQPYLELEQLAPEQFDSLIEASIDRIMAEDRADCYSAKHSANHSARHSARHSAKHRSDSLFKSYLCRYLTEWQRDSA